jgi:hypothetical protein
MPAAPYREFYAVFTREHGGRGNIAMVRATRYRSRVPVDHVVPDTAYAMVFPMLGRNDVAGQSPIQLRDLPVSQACAATRGVLSHLNHHLGFPRSRF